jgi:tRNA pseudouridine55 synthase
MAAESAMTSDVSGVLVVDKPVGPTSHDVVALARRALGTRRVGHTGTLDPSAAGVLPLVVGRATRLSRFLTARAKAYVATIRFGRTTDTFDATGAVTSETGRVPDRGPLVAALEGYQGTFAQTPPPYSAKKVEGVRAYRLARAARAVQPAAVEVSVHSIELVSFEGPIAEVRLVCSAGFYVRSLAHDLGGRLATGAVLQSLTRTRSGTFSLEEAVPLDMLEPVNRDSLIGRMHPLDDLLLEVGAITLTPSGVQRVRHGQDVGPADMTRPLPPTPGAVARLLDPDGRLLAIAEPSILPGFLHPAVVLG